MTGLLNGALAVTSGIAAVNGLMAYTSSKIFKITRDPKTAGIYQATQTFITTSIVAYTAFLSTDALFKSVKGFTAIDGAAIGFTVAGVGAILSLPVAMICGVVGGKKITNAIVSPENQLSYRQIGKIELARAVGFVFLYFYCTTEDSFDRYRMRELIRQYI